MKYTLRINRGPVEIVEGDSILDIVKLYKHDIDMAKQIDIKLLSSPVIPTMAMEAYQCLK